MSSQLPTIDLTGAQVGQQFRIDFTAYVKFDPRTMIQGGMLPAPASYQSPNAHIAFYNESGCGLQASVQSSGGSFFIPAGGWGLENVSANDNVVTLTVTYVLPSAPVSSLISVYYAPGEEYPPGYTLGNSPIGVSGSVPVTTVQTLSNEGNAAHTLVIDMGDVANAQLFKLYNTGECLWSSEDAGGALHSVIKVNNAAPYLQIGKAGDTVEALGALTVDQTLTAATTIANTVTAQAATDLIFNVPTAANYTRIRHAGTDAIEVTNTGLVKFPNYNIEADKDATFYGAITQSGTGEVQILSTHAPALYVPNGAVETPEVKNSAGNLALNAGAQLEMQVAGTDYLTVSPLQTYIDTPDIIIGGKIKPELNSVLQIDTQQAGDTIQLNNAGTLLMEAAATLIETFVSLEVNGSITQTGQNYWQSLEGWVTEHNGSVGGTIAICIPFWGGSFKVLILVFANYNDRNGYSTTLPSTVARGLGYGMWTAGVSQYVQFKYGANAINCPVATGFGSTSDGTQTTSNQLHSGCFYTMPSTCGTLVVSANTNTCNGAFLFYAR